ncbi:MAG: recombinase family protein [Patescibacteria group bacterium]
MNEVKTQYCLYARKSSESDERQAMSIDGQLSEMKLMAKKEKLFVSEIITESHSAKQSGQRPEFNRLLQGLMENKYNSILTWAPDRLSRNAGDLGRIVDFMDQGKLIKIQTYSQSFSNNPNEKFLLMILCSQAKLENDNRGINVKRGLRNKCEVGIRPGPAPIGYLNIMKYNRISTVGIDPERGPAIKEMFNKVANQGYSGRMIRKWLKSIDFKTRNNCYMALSRIYKVLRTHFYYGSFTFGDKLYKGNYEPLISKQIFDKVQLQLDVVPRQWNKQLFPFKKICKCGSCGGSVTAEIKHKKLISGKFHAHIYYHCNRIKNYDCHEPYITETELIKQLVAHLPNIKLNIPFLMQEFKYDIKRLQHFKSAVLRERSPRFELTPHNSPENIIEKESMEYEEDQINTVKEYLLHVMRFGTPEERVRILGGIESKFKLSNRQLILL